MPSSTSTPTVFICAATGSQGLNLSRQLREANWPVHATVRNPTSPPALALAKLGVNLTVGDWDNAAALASSMAGCTHLFLNTTIGFAPGQDPSHERIQAARILTLAKSAGVRHVVYSSALAIDRLAEVAHLDPSSIAGQSVYSKQAIEATLRTIGFDSWTVLRGASFMENYLAPKVAMFGAFRATGVWTAAYAPDTVLPLVDTDDIARFAVAVFRDPARFHGKGVAVAGDALTPAQIVDRLSKATGRKLVFVQLTEEEIATQGEVNPFIRAQLVIAQLIRFIDMEEPKSWGVPLTTFDAFLERNQEGVRETYL
ncbi:hypothetical protein B0T22DRAFT_510555 [Podospora appendiculata]|uniref:NmrA-like domain-containing protein n=1 Tax=Podospora appendiculata TaxID=314037 RepID=A0AAE0X848_9PEZI|nr:hypothetical protein B0T22DRAFT_510555 [Podospora appendiculata]